ncbi:SCO4225 family membrane protein [Streptomyces buecherae]|uniref:SCO4225 family membrane protein n=1 Tax=Streptomyces buecherae TaxID=2763006 RepID=UPI00369CA61F
MPETTPPHPFPRALRDALRSVFARVYLAACAALLIWALVVSHGENPDASFAGVVPLLATAPLSLVLLVLPDHAAMLYVAIGTGALVNALLIGWCARALRRGPRHPR